MYPREDSTAWPTRCRMRFYSARGYIRKCNWIDGSSASWDWSNRMGEEKGEKNGKQGSFYLFIYFFSPNGTAVGGNEHLKKGMGLPLFLPLSSSFLLSCRQSVNSRFISTAAWERARMLSAILSVGGGGRKIKKTLLLKSCVDGKTIHCYSARLPSATAGLC